MKYRLILVSLPRCSKYKDPCKNFNSIQFCQELRKRKTWHEMFTVYVDQICTDFQVTYLINNSISYSGVVMSSLGGNWIEFIEEEYAWCCSCCFWKYITNLSKVCLSLLGMQNHWDNIFQIFRQHISRNSSWKVIKPSENFSQETFSTEVSLPFYCLEQ